MAEEGVPGVIISFYLTSNKTKILIGCSLSA